MRVRTGLLGAALFPAIVLIALAGIDGPSRRAASPQAKPSDNGDSVIGEIEDRSMPILVAGGMVVSRSRHTIAGAGIGCVAGATVGAVSTLGLGLATGGAAFAALPTAGAVGCALGGASGAALGRPLDDYGDLSVLSALRDDGSDRDANTH